MAQFPIDDELRPKLGRSRSSGSATSQLGSRLARRSAVKLTGKGGRSAPGITPGIAKAIEGSQKAVVKVRYRLHNVAGKAMAQVRPGNLGEHLRYIQREAALLDEGRPELIGPDAEADYERTDVVSAWAQDRHHYRIIVSPEYAHQLKSMEDTTRHIMDALSKQLDRELEWVGAVHNNTDQPHAHVVLRGVANGKNLKLDRATVSYGIRRIAEEELTRDLGPRTRDQIREAYQAQVGASQVTDLDRILKRGLRQCTVNLRDVPSTDEARPHLAGRLQHLTTMGLAKPIKGHAYSLEPDFIDVLKDVAARDRAFGHVRKHLGAEASRVERYYNRGPDEAVEGRVLFRGFAEGGQRGYLIVDTGRSKIYAELPANYLPQVAIGGVAQVYDRGRSPMDAVMRELMQDGVLTDASIAAQGTVQNQLHARLNKLTKDGRITREKDGYRLTPQLQQAMEKGEALGRSAAAVRVMESDPPEQTIGADHWTAMDRRIARGTPPEWSGGAELYAARVQTLAERGLIYRSPEGAPRFSRGATDKLRDAEVNQATKDEALRLGFAPARIKPGQRVDGEIVGFVTLAQGRGVVLRHAGGVAVEIAQTRELKLGVAVQILRELGGRGVSIEPTDKTRDGAER